MNATELVSHLSQGTVLEGPHWPEPVRVLTVKVRGNRLDVQAVGIHSKKLWSKLVNAEDFSGKIKITQAADVASLSGNPTHFRLAAEAHRIRLAYQYDPHFAVSVSQVDPLPHQMDAVYGHLLTQPQIRFLIADDPGAGKTIMAGLTLKELKCRGLVERTLIITPASLTDQWRRELHDKFNETFTVINRSTVGAAFGKNVWEDNSQCITSVDFVSRQDDIMNMLREVRWDLVIVDEAHKMAAYRYGQKISKTQRYEFGEFIRDRTDHLLFLTATPHKGDPDNFALLLQLLDRDLYVNGDILAEASTHDENKIMIRRLKEDMKKFDGSPCFPPRHVKTLPYALTADELKLYEEVTHYVQENFQRAEQAENRNVGLALTVLQRRLASSTAAIRLSLERRFKKLKDLQKLGKIRQEYGELPEDMEDLTEEDRWKFEDDLVERVTMAGNMAELETEITELEQLVTHAKHNEKHVPETKFEELRGVISTHLSGKDERLLVFTEHKDTLDFLVRKLSDLGFYCCTIHGGMPLEKRIASEREFFEHKPSIMIATEAAGEGINLQFCSLMVNYDIPWNPNRLEQRMGRIHRYKQEREVMIFNLVAGNTREGQVMQRLLTKLNDMRKALGSDRVYDVIGEIIPAPKFDALMKDWLSKRRTMQEILAEIDLQTDETQVQRIRADMDDKALGSRHIDISKLDADRQKSKENRLMPEYIEKFFVEAYRSFGGTIAAAAGEKQVWSISRVPPDLRKLPDSLERRFGRIGGSYPAITFDKERAVGYSEIEFVGPGHSLFEGVVERVLRDYGPSLRQGACFYNADATEPSVLWLLKCGVEDGRGMTVGERLVAIHGIAGDYKKSQPYALLDLKAPETTANVPDGVRQSATDEDRIIDWSLEAVTPDYFNEINSRRTKELTIKEKYVRKSLQFLIAESLKKIGKYDQQLKLIRDESDPKRLNVQGNRAKEEARKNELSHRLKVRLAEIEQERHLSEKPPEVFGVAVILPPPKEVMDSVVMDNVRGGMQNDPEVEAIAVEFVKKHEIAEGRKPVSVEEENCGWDISSLKAGQVVRYIEVKGRSCVGGVALTPNEWIKAQRFGKDYWLYIVTDCKTNPQLHLVQDPATRLSPKEEMSVVRYMVGVSDWQKAATASTKWQLESEPSPHPKLWGPQQAGTEGSI
ncbi:MAG TPA: helicase-related protein [Tepidisphaeraceae bacterium]|jgi:superfamily II DNA or RNA helicase|nr:helicase-related protein [Tepidisphaeraceae bacterium]